MPEPITMYGATHCEDTLHTRTRLKSLNTRFQEANIDCDPAAEAFVRFINGGYRSTPTQVIGVGKWKMVIAEPTNSEVDDIIRRAGYAVP